MIAPRTPAVIRTLDADLRDPDDPDDPDAMTADQRAREVAAMLAAGYMRLRAASRPGAANASVSQPSEPVRSRENELADSGDVERVCAPGERS